MSGPKLTPAQVTEMAELREQGWSYSRLAERFGITTTAVHYRCLSVGALSPRSRPVRACKTEATGYGFGGTVRRFTEDEDARLLDLSRAGNGIAAVAMEMGRPRTSVRIRLLTLEAKAELAL